MVDKYESYIVLLCTIPGTDRSSAITILSEIGVGMTQFGSSKRLCCWIGLTPGNNESAGKKKFVRISRAGVYLRPALVQVAHVTAKDKLSPYYALKYERMLRIGTQPSVFPLAFVVQANLHPLNVACSCAEWYKDASPSGKAPFSGCQISIKAGHPTQVMLTGQALGNFIFFLLAAWHRAVHILADSSKGKPSPEQIQ